MPDNPLEIQQSRKYLPRLALACILIYACGDVTGIMPFTHVAEYQAGVVIDNALFRFPKKADYSAIPWVIYTDPELARVGKNETQAAAEGLKIETVRFEFSAHREYVFVAETFQQQNQATRRPAQSMDAMRDQSCTR